MPKLSFKKVHTNGGHDYYAVFNEDKGEWLDDTFVSVPEGTTDLLTVEDAFFRGDIVQGTAA